MGCIVNSIPKASVGVRAIEINEIRAKNRIVIIIITSWGSILNAEIIVSDSSTDSSPKIAKNHKVKLVKHDLIGYENAYLQGFKHAKGKYIFMADPDCSYDFSYIPVFLKYLKALGFLLKYNLCKSSPT